LASSGKRTGDPHGVPPFLEFLHSRQCGNFLYQKELRQHAKKGIFSNVFLRRFLQQGLRRGK
jgi:hypothetical protein